MNPKKAPTIVTYLLQAFRISSEGRYFFCETKLLRICWHPIKSETNLQQKTVDIAQPHFIRVREA